MGNRLKARFEAAKPIPASLERAPAVVAWDQLDDGERESLQRSEERAMDGFDQWAQQTKTAQEAAAGRNWAFPWVTWAATSCAVVLVAVGVWSWLPSKTPAPQQWPSLQTQGHAQLQWRSEAKETRLDVDVPAARTAQLADLRDWRLDAQGGSRLALRRRGPKQVEVTLKRGALVAQVTPNAMKAFVVRCRARFEVVVKGTVFAVRQGPGWLRVEVMRGRVEVRRSRDTAAIVNAGEGVRFTQDNATPRRYPIHTKAAKDLPALMRWLRAHAPQELMRYAADIASQRSWAPRKRRVVLETIANLLSRERRFQQASQLWQTLYKLQPTGFDGQTALFQAAQQCRRGQPKGAACVALYQAWLKQFPQGMRHLHEASMVGLIHLFHQRRQRARRDALIKQYLARHPKGLHRRSIRQLQR